MEVLHILPCYAEVRGIKLVQHIELLAHQIASEADGPRAIIVVDIAIYLVFIEPLSEQMPNNDVYFWTSGVVCEASRVGHHATIHCNSSLPTEHFETSELPNDAKHDFASAAHLGQRHQEACINLWIEMMVEHNSLGSSSLQSLLHVVYTVRCIKVKAENKVGFGYTSIANGGVFVVAHHLFYAWQPSKKIGEGIGNNDKGLFTHLSQVLCPCQ